MEYMSTEKMELQVLESDFKFAWNFEDVKASLADYTEKYVGLVVSEDNLKEMEATGREVASLRTKVEKFRKAVKADMDKPYKAFEKQVDELKTIISNIENPIKDQLQKYEDERIAKVKDELLKYVTETAKSIGLREDNAHISILAKWTNRTAKKTDVRQEICVELDHRLAEQRNEDNRIYLEKQKEELLTQLCASNSELFSLQTPLIPREIKHLTNDAQLNELADIVKNECKERAERELKVANSVMQATIPQAQPEVQIPNKKDTGPMKQNNPVTFELVLKFSSLTVEQAKNLCAFCKNAGISCTTLSKKRNEE